MALGGSSAMNACVFVPPSKDVIDGWEKLGNIGWNWETMRSYFQKVFSVPKLSPEVKKHLGMSWSDGEAFNGPLKTSFPCQMEGPLVNAWDKTFERIGYMMIRRY
jgi:choline dehydrogenase-like flavoprotein